MSLRPKAIHWFETYVPRDQTVYALEALAATGRVELEKDYVDRPILDTERLRGVLQGYRGLVERYAGLLPAQWAADPVFADSPEATARAALVELRRWLAAHLRLQRRLHAHEREQRRLLLVRRCLDAMQDSGADLTDLGQDSRFLSRQVYVFPRSGAAPPQDGLPGLSRILFDDAYAFRIVLCLPEDREMYDQACHAPACEALELPDWLFAQSPDGYALIGERLTGLEPRLGSIRQALERHLEDAALAGARRDLSVLDWYLEHTVTLTEDRRHCYVTGWTTADSPGYLQQILERAGIDAKILFRPAFPGHPPPVEAGGTRLFSPFSPFVQMFGTPGAGELDPTPLLSVLVPVIFGFMFPDLGHGLVLAAASLLLSTRFPTLRFLVPCGLAAAVFGVLFGEAFGLRGPFAAVLIRPLEDPLSILLASLGLGAGIILLGLALSGIEAYWRGALREWLWLDGAVLTLYASGLVGLLHPAAWLLTLLALPWYLIGLLSIRRGHLWSGLGRLAHSTLELVLNTLSFSRIGAFALAHAALSHALLEISTLFDDPVLKAIVLVLGHASIIVVEGLVVFVQTTRLILFEFFSRFLHADGRLFRPLAAPAARP